MDIKTAVKKWHKSKEKLEKLEEKIKTYKLIVSKELDRSGKDKLEVGDFTISRRRNTRTYLTKDSVPDTIWKEYSTRCSYDAYFLVKKK